MSETLIPAVVDQSTLSEVDRLENLTRAVVVTNPIQREAVYTEIKNVKGIKSRIVAFFKPSKEKAAATHKQIVADEKSFTDRLDAFEAAGKRAILTYDQKVEAERLAEQRRLQAIADEQARKEREKAEQEAARQRQIEEEARAKAEAARKAAEQANAEERARLLKEAEAADRKAAAANAKAEVKAEAAAAVQAPVIQIAQTNEKQKGEATKGIWKARVINAALVPREYCIPNEQELNAIAKATKGAKQIPGVEMYEEKTLSVRRAA
jgi:hypothetical protein